MNPYILKPTRGVRKPDIVVCIRCHAWCYPAQVSTDNLCPRCKEKEEGERNDKSRENPSNDG